MRYIIIGSCCFLLFLNSCSNKSTNDDDGLVLIEGITETDESGNIISTDPEDWQCSNELYPNDSLWICTEAEFTNGEWDCFDSISLGGIHSAGLPNQFCLQPAFPNPTSHKFIHFQFSVPVKSEVTLWVIDQFTYLDTIISDTFNAGVYAVEHDIIPGDTGMYRLFMKVDGWQSYGDVQLVK